jgi:hypothetical protein
MVFLTLTEEEERITAETLCPPCSKDDGLRKKCPYNACLLKDLGQIEKWSFMVMEGVVRFCTEKKEGAL